MLRLFISKTAHTDDRLDASLTVNNVTIHLNKMTKADLMKTIEEEVDKIILKKDGTRKTTREHGAEN